MPKSLSAVLALALAAGLAHAASPAAPGGNRLDAIAISELAADAGTRTSLLQSEGGFGRDDRGFYIAQGDMRLYIAGMVQFRYLMTFRDTDTDADDFTNGFENRRSRLITFGQIDKDISYRIQAEYRSDGGMILQDASVAYSLGEGWRVTAGQFKLPLLREELVTDLSQLAVERSVTNATFNQGRSQGVELAYEGEAFRVSLALSDGLITDNTKVTSSREADFAVTARGEYKFAGEWKQFRDFSGWREGPLGVMLGGAAHYQAGGETGGTNDVDVLEYTTDLSLEGSGWSAYGAFIGRHRDETAGEFDDFGVVVQGGLFATEQVEIFGRYDVVIPDDARASDPDPFNTISAGATYFLIPKSRASHVRLQVAWFLDAQAESIVNTSTNNALLSDTQGDQVAVILEYAIQW